MTGDEITKETMAYSKLSDMAMASKVRMLYRTDLDHESVVCGARDRIVYLSQELHKAHLRLAKAREIIESINVVADTEVTTWLANEGVSYSCRENDTKVAVETLTHFNESLQRKFKDDLDTRVSIKDLVLYIENNYS